MSDFSVLKYYLLKFGYTTVNILNECLRILSTAASSPKPITTCCSVLSPEIVMHDAYICGCLRRTKITCKASNAAEYIELFGSFTRDICIMHDAYIGRRSENNINVSCMMISGGRTKQLDIFSRVTGFYEWFSQFRSCGTYSVLSWRPSIVHSFVAYKLYRSQLNKNRNGSGVG